MMTGKITWIGPLTRSKKGGVFRIVSFELLDADGQRAQVYLDPENRNYARWIPLLEEGNIIIGLVWRDKGKRQIDGDSPVSLC